MNGLNLDHLEARARAAYIADERAVAFLSPGQVLKLIELARRAAPVSAPIAGDTPAALFADAVARLAAHDHGAATALADKYRSALANQPAPKELGLDIAVAVNQRLGKYIAANKPALMLLNEEELAALYRFQEICEDSDSGGYDVGKEMMKRLAAIGVIESKGFGRYQFTEFGDFVIERAALANQPAPTAAPEQVAPPLLTDDMALAAELEVKQVTGKEIGYRTIKAVWEGAWKKASKSQPSEAAPLAEKVYCPVCSGTGGVIMEGDCSDCNGKGYAWEPAAPSLPAAAPAPTVPAAAQEQADSASQVDPSMALPSRRPE